MKLAIVNDQCPAKFHESDNVQCDYKDSLIYIDMYFMGRLMVALLVVAMFVLVSSIDMPATQTQRQLFNQFQVEFDKKYTNNQETLLRFEVFKENLAKINAHNALADKSFAMEINRFTDLTYEQFEQLYLTPQLYSMVLATFFQTIATPSNPNMTIDWTELKKVSKVKDQRNCGSCYAFVATAALQSALMIAGSPQLDLSEQQLIDCSTIYGNRGCKDGTIGFSFEFMMKNGVVNETLYEFINRKSDCHSDQGPYKIKQYKEYFGCSEIERALMRSPVAVGISFQDWGLVFYQGGVYDKCIENKVSHAVLLVGATAESWKLKNSWGEQWGNKGYFEVKRGNNNCQICLYGAAPILHDDD